MGKRENWLAAWFVAPNAIGFAAFTLLPVAAALLLSLFQWDIFHEPRFVGLGNFRNLLGWVNDDGEWRAGDPRFWQFLGNTFYFMLAIPLTMAASLVLAVVLNQKLPGRVFFRTIFFLPSICMGVGVLLLWKFMYMPDIGMINRALRSLGIEGPDWLSSYHWAKPAIMNVGIWASMGGTNMILYLAGLQGIPPEQYEAAEIDGANRWQQFWNVTIPMLTPTTFFILITSIIYGFQGEFDSAYVMTQGGPDGSTTTLAYYIYSHAFEYFNMGYAAAIAVAMFVLILIVTLINWHFFGSKVHYV